MERPFFPSPLFPFLPLWLGTVSSKLGSQNQFHPKTTFIPNHFHPKTTFFQDHPTHFGWSNVEITAETQNPETYTLNT